MTKTIRKLLGYLLVISLLLSCVSALAETGTVTVKVPPKPEKGFNNPAGIVFEAYKVANSVGTGTTWEATSEFAVSAKGFETAPAGGAQTWSDAEIKAILDKIEADLTGKTPTQTQATNNEGKAVFKDLVPGIYYIRKNPESKTLLTGNASLIAVPFLSESNDVVTKNGSYDVEIAAKYEFEDIPKIDFPVNKIWQDDNNFDGLQPPEIKVHLHRSVNDVEDMDFAALKSSTKTLDAINSWRDVWENLDKVTEDNEEYHYYVTEEKVANYDDPIIDNATGTVTNPHHPKYGAIVVYKQVRVNGQPTTGKLADGIYNFTITGPRDEDFTKNGTVKNEYNHLDNFSFKISITDGKTNSWSYDKLTPGIYTIKEDTSSLTNGMTIANGNAERTIEVKAENTAQSPAVVTYVNNLPLGSLKITKAVTVNGSDTKTTLADGTYKFTVKGPSYPDGEVVPITITNGVSNFAQLNDLLLGEYEVTETKTDLPVGVSYVSGDTKKTLVVTNTAKEPLTFDFLNNKEVGSLKITKSVTVNGSATKTTLADGTYTFTVKGPSYPDGKDVSIKITNGESNFAQLDDLLLGEYEVAETKTDLPAGVSYVSGDTKKTLAVTNTTESPLTFDFVNNKEVGSLKITKSVIFGGSATTTTNVDGTYKFTVKGPSYPDGKEVSIKITNGKSESVQLDNLLLGEYEVTETKTELPSGVSYVSGDAKKTLEVTNTTQSPLTFDFVNGKENPLGSLKITKSVTVNGTATTSTRADGTYRFTVKGPSYPTGKEVTIKITNGKSNSVQLDNLQIGEYEVTETKTGLPSGVQYVSGDGKKTLAATNTAQNPLTFPFVNNRTTTTTTTNPPRVTPTPPRTTEPPESTPTPTPTPSPTPAVNINGEKVWRDEGNTHNTRPTSIRVQLMRDGEQIREITVTGSGNRWSYSFGNLPKVDEQGAQYSYTVRETPVEGYTTTVRGTSIINDLEERTPQNYTNFTGTKIWKDDEDSSGERPNYITVRLLRDGREVDRRTVTAANGWQFTFQNVPLDDGYGNTYRYTIREDSVPGYVGRVEDFEVTNSRLPEREVLTEFSRYGTPLAGFGEPELEELLELYDYGTPLWGRPLQTGDELPLYPIVFGGIGCTALIALVVLMILNKKKGRNAA